MGLRTRSISRLSCRKPAEFKVSGNRGGVHVTIGGSTAFRDQFRGADGPVDGTCRRYRSGNIVLAVACLDQEGRPQIIPNDEGELSTPSVVFFDRSATVVGREAVKAAEFEPDRVAAS